MNPRISFILALFSLLALPLAAQDDIVARARKALEDGKASEAMTLLEENYSKLKTNLDALLLLARCSLETGQDDKAMDYALRAVDLDKQNFDANRLAGIAFFWRAQAKAASGRSTSGQIAALFEEAAAFLGTALAVDPSHADLWGMKGEALFMTNDKDSAREAAKDLSKAFEMEPGNLKWVRLGAGALRVAGDLPGAVALVEKALKKQPGKAELLMLLGDLSGLKNDIPGALKAYRRALKAADVDQQTAGKIAGYVWQILGTKKKFDEALSIMEDWRKAHADDYTSHWWAGYYLLQLGRHDEAIAAFKKAFDVSGGKNGSSAVYVARCFWAKGEMDKGAEWLVKASRAAWQSPNDRPMDVLLAMAGRFFGSGKLEEAVAFLRKYGEAIDPGNWSLLNNIGLACRDLVEQKGKDPKVWSKLSAEYYERASKAVLADPNATPTNKAMVLNDTGILFHFPHHKINDITKAVGYYRKALSFDPNYVDALENLGLCMNKLGRYEEAADLFKKVLDKHPGRRVSLAGLKKAEEALKK